MRTLRRKILWLTLGVFLILVVTFTLFSYFSEPRHNGRRLSAWLALYNQNIRLNAEVEEAVRAIGTNAIPTLVKMLIPGGNFSVVRLVERAGLHIELIEDTSDRWRDHNLAMHGFRILGPQASNAVPQLLTILENSDRAYFAAEALQTIGSPALAPVQQLLTSTNVETKRHSVHIILSITRRDTNTVSRLLTHPDHFIRGETYLWLRSHNLPPAYILSTLLDGLNDPHTYAAQRAVIGIRSLPLENATNALPRLYELQSTTNALLARELTNAIKNIEKRVRIEQSSPRQNTFRR